MNSDRIGGDDFIEFAEVIIDQPAIEIDHQLLGLQVNRLHEAEIAIEDIFVVVVDVCITLSPLLKEQPKRSPPVCSGSPLSAA